MYESETRKGFLRVGVIGCGKMSRNHAKAVSLAADAEIVAVTDPAIDTDDIPEWFPEDVKLFTSADEMILSGTVDVVHIVTPPSTHFSIAKLALDNGVHVYIEKPFVSTIQEANELQTIAAENRLKLCAGHQLLFTRAARLLRNSLDSVGRVVSIESYFSFNTVRRGITPVEQLTDILPHPVYLLEEFLNRSRRDGKSTIEIDVIRTTNEGEARGLVTAGDVRGFLNVSLLGRPVDSYVKITGENGTLHADFVRGYVVKSLGPGASVFSVLLLPFSQGIQIFFKTAGAILRLFSDRKKGYPGLPELISTFYRSISEQAEDAISPTAIGNTVRLCEAVVSAARDSEFEFEKDAEAHLATLAENLAPTLPGRGRVLITGGTGMFGHPTAKLLRERGWPVTVLSRSVPPPSRRLPGVQYVKSDLGETVAAELLHGVESIIHAAAETAGGQSAQERNSIQATRNLLEAAQKSGVRQFIHISSIAVLKPGTGGSALLDETSPVDLGNLSRGPYVWGKAESENIAANFDSGPSLEVKIVRLGPLVDYENYHPPGRLGREIHNLYVAMGGARDKLSVCSVQTAAEVMATYLTSFEEMPLLLNLVEPDAPTRRQLTDRWKAKRSPLRVVRVPFFVLSLLSPLLVLMQKVLLRSENPVNIKSAFSSERYSGALASSILKRGSEH